MEETFTITLIYNNQERDFPATLQLFGYTHKITVIVNDTLILFEPDEERNYRAALPFGEKPKKEMDAQLLGTIAQKLEEIFSSTGY